MDICIGIDRDRAVHFVGVGGVSMSALARLLHASGYRVTGSDARESENTRALAKLGIPVVIGHAPEAAAEAGTVIYTDAVGDADPDLASARSAGRRLLDRGSLLGMVSESFLHSIAVSGTHGKTTTTSMLASVFLAAGLNPTVHVGAATRQVTGGCLEGGTEYFITEACEYKRNLLKVARETAVVLNADTDHMDYFKDLSDILNAYAEFLGGVRGERPAAVINGDDISLRSIRDKLPHAVTFGIRARCDYKAKNLRCDPVGRFSFDLTEGGELLGRVSLSVLGRHNVYNALAAAAVARRYGVSFAAISEGLAAFTGAARRLEHGGEVNGANVVLDYAHHPAEIRAVMEAVRHTSRNRLVVVFEPHTYTRLKAFLPEFAACFRGADVILLAKVYAAREKPIRGVNSRALAGRLKKNGYRTLYLGSYERIAEWLKRNLEGGDLCLILGAGDIDTVWEMMK